MKSRHSLRVALLQHAYWSGGFERPLFLALSDGTVLYPRTFEHGIPATYNRLSHSPSQTDSLLTALGADSSLYGLDSLSDYAPGVSDQHSFYLLLPWGTGLALRTIRAGRVDSTDLRPDVPPAFQRFYRHLRSLARHDASEWTPDSVEVEVWPYEYAPDNPPLQWPADLPGFRSGRWHRRTDAVVEEVRTVRLPFTEASRLDSLLRTQRERQALLIDRGKWTMSYRWIFPGEEDWWRVARRLEY